MSETFGFLIQASFIGAVATAIMDVWTLVLVYVFGAQTLDYAHLGRWLLYLPRGRFRHHPISATVPVRGERLAGWMAHYLTGIAFAALLLAVFGLDWAQQPSLPPALIVGVGTVLMPFLVMQPGMGAGIAARLTPHPNRARLKSLVTHSVFGLGLYAGGRLAAMLPM
jgi:hypothetical protein